MKRKTKLLYGLIALLLIISIAMFAYLNDYYHADVNSIVSFAGEMDLVETELRDGVLLIAPEDADTAFVFYPGGKVECSAYLPLMRACAAEGIACVLVQMPFNLAVLDINAADGIQKVMPEIENWYIGGHSLGGSMAASYISNNAEDYEGIILLGSYSTADISSIDLDILSIYGSEDGVLNREKYNECRINLPADFTEFVIKGGNHAGFGMYGKQDGDGKANITNEEQIDITAKAIAEFVK